ncbi:inhibin alpha chain [Discoglossus pictus]
MASLHLFLMYMVVIDCPSLVETCEIPDGDQQVILARVKSLIIDALGPPPTTNPSPAPSPNPRVPVYAKQRTIHKRHSKSHRVRQEDTSKVILFPSSDAPCDAPGINATHEDPGTSFTYIFRPSPHILSRRVSSAQLWFYTGQSVSDHSMRPVNMKAKESMVAAAAPRLSSVSSSGSSSQYGHQAREAPVTPINNGGDNSSQLPLIDLKVLSELGPVSLATSRVDKMDDWTLFHLTPAFLRHVTQGLFALLIYCQSCPCSDQAEYTPFLMFITHPTHRARRSGVPWSPSALELLQRPPASAAGNAHCHRASVNISFEELGWEQWIVHPASFQFHYCHGTCSPNHGLSPALHWGHCCAALPSTMKPLRVTTTTDGGFSYRYETVPNLLTQDCACS